MTRFAALVAAAVTFVASSPAMAQSASNGDTLYHTYCVSCHGDPPSGGPDRATSGAFIANTIRTNPSMQFLRSDSHFNDANITASTNDIYAWLQSRSNPPPPPPAPTITSAASASGTVGQAFSYQITATNSPTGFNASGLPAGLNVNTGTGLISGTPTAAGSFSALIHASNAGGTATQSLAITISNSSTPPPPVVPNTPGPLSGVWYNVNEGGWGVYFAQRNNLVFVAWYTYDASGNPRWYSSLCSLPSGVTGTTGTCTGQVLDTSGPPFFGVPFDTLRVSSAPAGNLQIVFQDINTASMTYSAVAGQTRTVALKRFPLAAGAAPTINYTDIWWGGASESGWGMAITHQVSTLFFAWYVYDSSGKPTWYAALCTMAAGNSCTAPVTRTTGPPFGPTFDTTQVNTTTVGTLNVTFTDANTASLSYTVNGVSGSKTVVRLAF